MTEFDFSKRNKKVIAGNEKQEILFPLDSSAALDNLNPAQFQYLVRELLSRQGFEIEATPLTRDGGVDAYACFSEKRIGKKYKIVVQAKRYSLSKSVGAAAVRDLLGAIQTESADRGIVITTSCFTKGALDSAFKVGNIKLIDRLELIELLKDIGLLFETPRLESILQKCATQVKRNTAVIRGNMQNLDKKFIPELYVARSDAKSYFNGFIEFSRAYEQNLKDYHVKYKQYENEKRDYEEKVRKAKESGIKINEQEHRPPIEPIEPKAFDCAALVGEAGIGKTNLFCDLCDQLLNSESPALFYAGHTIIEDLEATILSDLYSLVACKVDSNILTYLDKTLKSYDRFLVIFIDAINESRNYMNIGNSLAVLLNKLKELETTRIKVFISCRDIEWSTVILGSNDLVGKIFQNQPFFLRKFDIEELRNVWERYRNAYRLKTVHLESLSKKVLSIIDQPLMLRFLCEAYTEDYIPQDIERLDIFEKYWERKLDEMEKIGLHLGITHVKNEATTFLFELVDKMRELKQREILEYDAEKLGEHKTSDRESVFIRLLSEHIIIYSRVDERINSKLVGFTYETFFEYVLAKSIYVRNKWSYLSDKEIFVQFRSLVEEFNEYRPIKGALQYLMLFFAKEERSDLYVKMLNELTKTHQGCEVAYETIARLKIIDAHIFNILKQIIIETTGKIGIYRSWGRDHVAVEVLSNIPDHYLLDVFNEWKEWISCTNNMIHANTHVIGLAELVEERPEKALGIFTRIFSDEQFRWCRQSLISVFWRTDSCVNDDTIKILMAMACDQSRITREVPIQFVRKLSPNLKEKLFEYMPKFVENRDPAIRDLAIDILSEVGKFKREASLTILRDMENQEIVPNLRLKITRLSETLKQEPP